MRCWSENFELESDMTYKSAGVSHLSNDANFRLLFKRLSLPLPRIQPYLLLFLCPHIWNLFGSS